MSNCIQFTIGDKIYKFRDVDLKKSATLDDIISAIAEDPNYAGQLEDLNIDLNSRGTESISSTKEIPNDITDRNTYIAENLMGNLNHYALSQIYKRVGVPNSEFFTAFKDIMDRSKGNRLSFLVTDSPTQTFLGNSRDLVVINKNDLYNQPKLLGALSYVYSHSQLLDNQSAIYKIVEDAYTKILESPTRLREELLNIPDKYSALRRLLYYTQSDMYDTNDDIANLKMTIGNHLFAEVTRNILRNKDKEFFNNLKLNPVQYKALENLIVNQELPNTINFGDYTVSVSELNKFRLDYIEAERNPKDDTPDIDDDSILLRLATLNPNGAFDANMLPANKEQRLMLLSNPISAFVFDTSNFNKVSKYVTKFEQEVDSSIAQEEREELIQSRLQNVYTSFGKGRLDVNGYVLDLIQEASTNKLDFKNSEDIKGFNTMFYPNTRVNMDESLTSKPNRLLRFNHSQSLSKFSESAYKVVFNPKVKYVNVVGGSNARIEINPNFNLEVTEDFQDKIDALEEAATKINKSSSKRRALSVKYNSDYDYSIEEGSANINKAINSFRSVFKYLQDAVDASRTFYYLNTDGIGQFSQAMVVNADQLGITPVVFDELSKWVYSNVKSPDKAEWIKTFTSLMNSAEYTDSALFKFYDSQSFKERAFSSKRVDSSGKLWENLNARLTKIEEERGPLSQFDMLKEGVISMIPILPQGYNYALTRKEEGDIFKLKNEKDRDQFINVEVQRKIALTYRKAGGRNISSPSELMVGDVIRINPNDTYQAVVLENRPEGKFCAWVTANEVHSGVLTNEDLKNVVRTQYTAENRQIGPDVRAFYTNVGVFRTSDGAVDFRWVNNESSLPILHQIFADEITEIAEATGFTEDFIKRNYLNTVKRFQVAMFMELTPTTEEINSTPNVETLSDNLSTPEFVEDLVSSLAKSGVQVTSYRKEELKEKFPTLDNVKAFIYDGEVIVNSDLMTDDTLLHELSHLFLADLKSRNYDKYVDLVRGMEGSDAYDTINNSKAYDELTYNDKLEEALVHEFSQYFTRVLKDYRGRNLKLDEIEWDGIISDVLNIDVSEFYDDNIYTLMRKTLSEIHSGYAIQKTLFNKSNAQKMVKLSNIKSSLMKNLSSTDGYGLIEICE